jgi:uncharacterized damage-inducible protein DinB
MSSMTFISPEATLEHWQGHRRVTRRVIEAFPEDKLFSFSVGGMRSFGEMCNELLAMTVPMTEGTVSGDWGAYTPGKATTKAALLAAWDADTQRLSALWPKIPAAKFAETVTAFGAYTGKLHDLFLYVIDNEIHHRGQGYVYLRALGVEPPPFYERS